MEISQQQLCPVIESCGGCPNLAVSETEELSRKRTTVLDAFAQHNLRVTVGPIISTTRTGYRNRIRLQVIDGQVGFFNRAKRLGCAVLRTKLWEAYRQLSSASKSQPLRSIFRDAQTRHLEIRVDDFDKLGLYVPEAIEPGEITSVLDDSWVVGTAITTPVPTLSYRTMASPATIKIPLDCFTQVNSEINQKIVKRVIQLATESAATQAYDLFSGAGNYTISLIEGSQVQRCVAVEQNQSAANALSHNAGLAGRVKTICSDLTSWLESEPKTLELVIVNPPRAGLRETATKVAALGSTMLIYISCNPQSLARDVAAMVSNEFALSSIECFNMFPGTQHIETLAVLTRQ